MIIIYLSNYRNIAGLGLHAVSRADNRPAPSSPAGASLGIALSMRKRDSIRYTPQHIIKSSVSLDNPRQLRSRMEQS